MRSAPPSCRYFEGHKALQHACESDDRMESAAHRARILQRQEEARMLAMLEKVHRLATSVKLILFSLMLG